jgi:hypothetical protein
VSARCSGAVPLLIHGALEICDAGLGGVDVDGVIALLAVEPDLEIGVIAGERGNLCAVEGEDVVDDCLDGLLGKVRVVDAEIAVEPAGLGQLVRGQGACLVLDKLVGDEALCGEGLDDDGELVLLAAEGDVCVPGLLAEQALALAVGGEVRRERCAGPGCPGGRGGARAAVDARVRRRRRGRSHPDDGRIGRGVHPGVSVIYILYNRNLP